MNVPPTMSRTTFPVVVIASSTGRTLPRLSARDSAYRGPPDRAAQPVIRMLRYSGQPWERAGWSATRALRSRSASTSRQASFSTSPATPSTWPSRVPSPRWRTRRGASYVEVNLDDPHVRRERIRNGTEESLDWSPPWTAALLDHLIGTSGAHIAIGGDPEPELMQGVDPGRLARARPLAIRARQLQAQNDRLYSWTIIACPTAGWAESVFGEPDLERLWHAVERAVRLDEPDPVEAWRESHRPVAPARGPARRARVRRCALPSGRGRISSSA